MIFPAWLVVLTEGSFVFDLSLRRTEGSSGSLPWFWISFPRVSSRGADLIQNSFPEDSTCPPGRKQPKEFVPRGLLLDLAPYKHDSGGNEWFCNVLCLLLYPQRSCGSSWAEEKLLLFLGKVQSVSLG